MHPSVSQGIVLILLVGLATAIYKLVASTFPRREIKSREYGWVALWAWCCAGGIGLAFSVFWRVADYILGN
jgi:hypothetical protein